MAVACCATSLSLSPVPSQAIARGRVSPSSPQLGVLCLSEVGPVPWPALDLKSMGVSFKEFSSLAGQFVEEEEEEKPTN